jgi:hypothetical protein
MSTSPNQCQTFMERHKKSLKLQIYFTIECKSLKFSDVFLEEFLTFFDQFNQSSHQNPTNRQVLANTRCSSGRFPVA